MSERIKHPSFANLYIGRSQCSGQQALFGSSIMERGVTGIYSYGCYKEKDRMMLMCIMRSREIPGLLEKIKRIDNKAFTIISEVREVRGEGF